MKFKLINTIVENASMKHNDDGTTTLTGVVAQTTPDDPAIQPGKFVQSDIIPPVVIPKGITTEKQPAYIETQAQAFVTKTYPNT